jgi:hypothetical protein
MRSILKDVLEDVLINEETVPPLVTDVDHASYVDDIIAPGFPASPQLSDIEEEGQSTSVSSRSPREDASLKDENATPCGTMKSDHLAEMHDLEQRCDVEHSSGVDELESTCGGMEATCSTIAADLSILDRLRELAAARFLAAAQSKELQSALQVVRASEQKPLEQNLTTPHVLSGTQGDAAEEQMPASMEEEDTADDKCSILQTLRRKALVGIVAAARSGDLGGILNSSSGAPAPPRQPVAYPNKPFGPAQAKRRPSLTAGV